MNSNEIRIKTNLLKYKVENVSQLAEIQEKRRRAFAEKRTTILFYQEPRVNMIDGHELMLYKLDKDIADNWLNEYHPFKAPKGNVLCLGLVRDSTIYCIMTFKKSRDSRYVAELSRLWMLPTYQVIDGYEILSSAASELGIYNIVAYVNMSFENYLDYESIGMKYVRDNQRTKWWIKGDDKMSDASRRQSKIKQETLIADGWSLAYDCGIRVYVV